MLGQGLSPKIQKKLLDFAKKRDWEKYHNLKNLAISISIESSELLEIFQWIEDKNIKLNLKDSVSPVLIEDVSDKNSYYVIMPMKI